MLKLGGRIDNKGFLLFIFEESFVLLVFKEIVFMLFGLFAKIGMLCVI